MAITQKIKDGRTIIENHRKEHSSWYPWEGSRDELSKKHVELRDKTHKKLKDLGIEGVNDTSGFYKASRKADILEEYDTVEKVEKELKIPTDKALKLKIWK